MFTILGTDGKEYGPVSTAKVQEWMIAGRANLETQVRRVGENEWRALGDVPELSGAAVPTPPPPLTPLTPAAAIPAMSHVAPPVTSTLPLANPFARLGAVLLDSLIGALVATPGFIVLGIAGALTDRSAPNTPLAIAGAGILCFSILVVFAIQIYLLTTSGQTIGKKIVGVKVVTFDTEENPGFVKIILLRLVVNGLLGFIPLYGLIDALFIFREDRRCIHDLLATTKVVKA